jgi:hypothetical protein
MILQLPNFYLFFLKMLLENDRLALEQRSKLIGAGGRLGTLVSLETMIVMSWSIWNVFFLCK